MDKIEYGVEVNIYAYGGNGLEVTGECIHAVGDRNRLTKSEAKGMARRLAEHLNEFTTESDSLEADDEAV